MSVAGSEHKLSIFEQFWTLYISHIVAYNL